MRWFTVGALGLFDIAFSQNVELPLELLSPSGLMKLTFTISPSGRPTYSLALEDQMVVKESGMGLEFFLNEEDPEDAEYLASRSYSDPRPTESFYDGFTLIAPGGPEPPVERVDEFEETWYPIWGEESEIVDHHNELLVRLVQTDSERYMNIRFRMFDEGVGFRYEFPMQPNLVYYRVKEERTQFAMTGDHFAWWNPGDYDTQEYNYGASYLSEIRGLFNETIEENVSQFPFSDTGVQTSLQMKTAEGLYINIHEAALVNYSCMHLELDDETFIFESHLTPDVIGVKAHLQAPNTSPWRTIIASYDARDILRSRITYNLNEPMDPAVDWSWVKPVKYMGVWWEMIVGHRSWDYTDDFPSVQLGITDYSNATPHGRHGATTEYVIENIDFAAEHGFDALLVEGWNIGWEDWFGWGKDYVFDFLTPYPDFDVERVRDHAREKGISMMMHHETSGSTRNYERHLDRAYKFMHENGYTSLKSGYVGNMLPHGQHHYSQDMINHFHHANMEAARYNISVNAHEAVRPTGLARTYPNMLAQESARGQEYASFSGNHPRNVAIIPFTRLLGGPMDYTPGVLNMDVYDWVADENSDAKVNSTIGYQLGLYLTMYSPLQMAADAMQNLAPHAGRALQFIEDVPIDWHKSVYIEAEPGEYLTIARLDKNDHFAWYMGNVNGLLEPRDSTFELDFLDEGTCYRAKIYHDSPGAHYWTTPHEYDIRYSLFTRGDTFSQWTAAGGGYAVQFVRLGPLTTNCDEYPVQP